MRVTSKGQVTIPLHIRQKFHIQPGSEVNFVIGEDDRVYLEKVVDEEVNRRFGALRGVSTQQLSTEEIMALTRGEN